jgi:hypothetical protein
MLVLFVHEMELVLCGQFNQVELIDLQPGCSLYLVRLYGFESFSDWSSSLKGNSIEKSAKPKCNPKISWGLQDKF